MKVIIQSLFIFSSVVFFTGCKEKIVDRYRVNSPVYMSKPEFKSAVQVIAPENIENPGKIYFKDSFIFINQPLKGIHVINNSNPVVPKIIAFIKIPGNVDIAIKDSVLYADSFVDLVALNISDINNIHEVGRVDSIFPYSVPPAIDDNIPLGSVDKSKGIVVGWEVKETEEEVKPQDDLVILRERMFFDYATNGPNYVKVNESGSGMSVGIAGSMARFTIYQNILYTVDKSKLKAFDIDDLASPLLVSDQTIGWNVETLFRISDKIFFGTQTGMIIYDISNVSQPKYVSTYNHVRSCDPVVVSGDYAYVTLRAGNLCGEATSQLDVIDISNILAPQWKQSYPMQEPYGLGIDDNILFVCDGPAGLKVYNANDPKHLEPITSFPEVNAFDVIPYNDVLIMIGRGGLYQYDYSGEKIKLLSYLPVGY